MLDDNKSYHSLNLSNICRACASEGDLHSIFDNDTIQNSFKITEMLMEVANIKVSEEDNLPKKICKNCIEQLLSAFCFKKQCTKVDLKLKNYLKISKNNTKLNNINLKNQNTCDELFNNFQNSTITESQLVNGSNTYTCLICNQIFIQSSSLSDHLKIHTDRNSSNKENQQSINTEDYVLIDTDSNHPFIKSNEKFCSKCNKFYKSSRFRTHQQIHLKPFICQTCGSRFGSNSNLKRHIQIHTGSTQHFCHICNKSFIQAINLKRHLTTHVETTILNETHKKFVCDICQQHFSSTSSLKRHQKRHTGEKPHTCHVCNKSFIQLVSLTDHLRVHSGEKPFTCLNCYKSFSTASNLRVHQKRHLPRDSKVTTGTDNEHVCNICTRIFLSKRALRKHAVLHGEKQFLCSNCGKCFISKEGLIAHERIHTGSRPYVCRTCNKSFMYGSSLRIHERIHTGVRPYVCTFCSKTFSHHTHLKNHLKTHSNEKPFTCIVCKKTFLFKGNLIVHLRIHSDEKPYKCSLCKKEFYHLNSLKKHQKQHLS